jgi:hypothetical protein
LGACFYYDIEALLDEPEIGGDPLVFQQAEIAFQNLRTLQEKKTFWEALIVFGQVEWSLGHFDRALGLAQEALEVSLAMPSEQIRHELEANLIQARVAISRGKMVLARRWFADIRASLDLHVEPTARDRMPFLEGMGVFYIFDGEIPAGIEILSAINKVYEQLAAGSRPRQRREHIEAIQAAREALGEKDFAFAWQAGDALGDLVFKGERTASG